MPRAECHTLHYSCTHMAAATAGVKGLSKTVKIYKSAIEFSSNCRIKSTDVTWSVIKYISWDKTSLTFVRVLVTSILNF